MAGLEQALIRVAERLDAFDLRYAVIGGVALAARGVLRGTRDVDFKIAVPDLDYDGVRARLEAEFTTPGRPQLPRNPLIVALNVDGVVVDCLLAAPGYDSDVVARAEPLDYEGRTINFCTAEDLIVLKVIANREKDWLDVRDLLEARSGELDLAFIRNWAAQFAEGLDRPELMKRLESLLA